MKKMTKLLSVILAFVMALSCMTMMASAAKETYQTVQNLTDKEAYSPYGTVTRLSTEERLSIVFDALDNLLAPLNITLVQDLSVLGTLNVDLRSVNGLCSTVDSIDSLLNSGFSGFLLIGLKGTLGVIGDLDVKTTWQNDMTRESYANTKIATELFELLTVNKNLIGTVLTDGLDLGVIAGFLKGVDLSSINKLVKDLPGAVKAIVLPMMSRQDDTQEQRITLGNKGANLLDVAQSFVNGLFTKPMSWTSYRVDATGADLGYTSALPTEADGTSRYFVKNADGSITQWDYQYEGILGSPKAGYKETVTYTLSTEEEYEGSGTYLYKAPEGYSGDATLKWYKKDGKTVENGRIQSAYWLPSVKAAMESGALSLKINDTDSLLGLLYKFIPYVFAEMAPTVLNGSVKQLIAKAFDVNFEKIGLKGSAEVAAEAAATGNPDNFFTKAQDFYVWEYSDYKVINGVPYYRFQDTYFKGEIPNNISAYYNIFNWDWNIGDDFINEFIPSSVGSAWVLDNFSAFIEKAINTMIADSWTARGVEYKRAEVFAFTDRNGDGKVDNADLLENIMAAARAFFQIAPEEILDDYYKEAQFYDAMMNGTLKQAVNGLVCELVKLIMPQIKFSDDIINQPITAIAAIVVRELCTQLMPTYNFDAMIYANYGKSGAPTRALINHTADEWLDITLYMGVNLGMYYLRNIADIGEDSDFGYYSVMADLGALPALSNRNTTAAADAITFAANSYKANEGQASWLVAVDWIVDWALSNEVEWAWHFEKLVDAGSAVSMKTYENPLNKINAVLLKLLPLEQVINTSNFNGTDYGSGTFVEKVLKDGIVDSIVNLDLTSLLSLVKIPDGVLKNGNIADNLVKIIVDLLNNLLSKVAGTNIINTSAINSVNTLLDHANLRTTVVNLVGALQTADSNGLLVPILPIANFFLGWKTDAQEYAAPSSYFTNNGGDSFFMANAGAKLTVTNKSAGMLLKHRNVDTVDQPYTITVKSIEFDVDGVSAAGVPTTIEPYASKDFDITIPANTAAVAKATITYTFSGKDGAQIGLDQKKIAYLYISDIDDDEGIGGANAGVDANYAELAGYNKYVFTTDILGSVTGYTATINGKASSLGSVQGMKLASLATVTAPQGLAGTYFSHLTTAEAGTIGNWSTVSTSQHGGSVLRGSLFKANAGVDADTFSAENSEANNLYGAYDMGGIRIKTVTRNKPVIGSAKDQNSNDKMVAEVTFIYYNDHKIDSVKDKYVGYNLTAKGYDAAAFNDYEAALKEVIRLADYPLKTDYVTSIQPQIEPAIKALEDAYTALMKTSSSSSSTGDISKVQAKLDSLETNPDRDINYQDYKLFEYFQYEKQRTAARNMIASTKGPNAPEKYIRNGVGGDELVDAIINAQANANVKAGINATVVPTTDPDRADEMANYTKALAEFKPTTYKPLDIDDQVGKLQYYYNFMVANTKNIDKTFLNQEIAYAEAQNYNSADYSADSWSRYTAALAAAKDAAANSNQESRIFDAKYELMLAQNRLEKHSMKESGYMSEELVPLIENANAIINNYGTLYNVKNGIAYADAFAQLVTALGVEYNVNVNGKDVEGILYDRSALTFTEYDRTDTAKNKRAVDAAADKLRAAIENFECTAKIESNNTVTTVDQSIRYIQGIVPNSLPTEAALLGKVNVVGSATPVVQVSKSGNYGTGARIELKNGDTLLATYFVVIYGDVNGDGAVDAFDAIEVDVANHTAYYMGDVYDDAADIDHNGVVNADDYAAIKTSVKCAGTISQN